MKTQFLRGIAALLIPLLTVSQSNAQQKARDDSVERTLKLLKAPDSPAELWDAVKFSLNVGKDGDAVMYLDRLLASNPPTELLLTIRERDAANYFPKMAATPELQKRVVELLRLTERAAKERARDPERISMFINYLTRSPQHRSYGVAQLRSAGPDAIPYLLAALTDPSLAEHHSTILQAMQRLESSAVPPLVAALAAPNLSLVSDVIEVLSVIGNADTVPHLRYIAESPEIPTAIQSQARSAIAKILRVEYSQLPAAAEVLTQQAKRHYEHRVDFGASAGGTVRLWRWLPPEGLKAREVTKSDAEEYFGLVHCQQALALRPTYEPAQIVLLSLALEKAADRAGVDQPLPEGPGQASAAALAAGPELLVKVLGQALQEKHPAVVLAALRAIGAMGDASVLAAKNGFTSPVMQALTEPDRRIQFAAAEVILNLRPQQPIPGTSLVITILAQALATDGIPKALVMDRDGGRGSMLSSLLSHAGYEAQFVSSARAGFELAATNSDFELIWIDANIVDPEISPTIASLATDPRTARIPIVVSGNEEARLVPDPLQESLASGETTQVLNLITQLGERVAASKLDTAAKESVRKQIDESLRVLRRSVRDTLILPPSRVFMSLILVELDKIKHEIQIAKTAADRAGLVDDCQQLRDRIQGVSMRLTSRRMLDVRTVTYPGEKELSKFERRYPRVKYLSRPTSLEMLKLQLASLTARIDEKPLTAAERADQARRAAAWLARIARGEIRGFDVRPAEPAILAALGNETIAPDLVVAAGCIPTATAQAALAQLVLNEAASAPLRVEAAHQVTHSIRQFGLLLQSDVSNELIRLLDHTDQPVLHQALASVAGAMKPRTAEAAQRLRTFPIPPSQPNAAPPIQPIEPGESAAQP